MSIPSVFAFNMKTFFTRFFVLLGVIFFVLLCTLAYLWFADPYGIRPMVDGVITPGSTETELLDKHPVLTQTQEKSLEVVGIDVTTLPTTLTKQQETCFTKTLGAPRVREILSGDTPTIQEITRARGCLKAE